jgi:hypothetical protein
MHTPDPEVPKPPGIFTDINFNFRNTLIINFVLLPKIIQKILFKLMKQL